MTKNSSKLSGIQISQGQSTSGAAAVALPNSIQMQGGKRNIINAGYQNSSGGHAHQAH